MAKYKHTFFALASIAMISSCSGYDDSKLWNDIFSLEERVILVREQLSGINTNINSLSTLASSIANGMYITSLTEEADGYSFTMNNSPSTYHILNGAKGDPGNNGSVPVIGVAFLGGIPYWTVNGQYLLDAYGQRISLLPTDGQDGSAAYVPVFSTYTAGDGTVYWQIDGAFLRDQNGNLVPLTGTDAISYNLFSKVEESEYSVTFTLHDGSSFTVSKFDGLVSLKSLSVLPEYADGSVSIRQSGNSSIAVDVAPQSAARYIVEHKSSLAVKAVETMTKSSTTFITLPVADVVANDGGLVISVNGSSLPSAFFNGKQTYSATVLFSDKNISASSSFFNLVPVK